MKKTKRITRDEIPFDIKEKIDIARCQRFNCDGGRCLTESAQYKIMFAEAMDEYHNQPKSAKAKKHTPR